MLGVFVRFYEMLDEVLDVDPKIRFALIYFEGESYKKLRKGITSILDDQETEKSLRSAIVRMNSRKMLVHKTGTIHYALGKYEKFSRITIPYRKDGLILFTTDPDADYDPISQRVIEIGNRYQ